MTLTGYDGNAYASATQVYANQVATNGSGSSIKILNHAKNGTLAFGIETSVAGLSGKCAVFENLCTNSYAGTLTQATQNEYVVGKFTSTAKSGTKSVSRTSNFGTAYDLAMVAAKGIAPFGILGYYIDPSMATATTGAIKGALSKAQAGDTINAADGTYNEDITINKAITLIGSGNPTANSFTLNTALSAGSGSITAPIVNVTSSAKIQDGIALTSSGGTLNVAAGKYSEDVNINKGLTIVGSGNPTVSSFSMTSGAVLGTSSGGLTAPIVNVASGSRINDGMKLLSDSGTINVASGYYGEDVTISKALTLKGFSNPTARSFTLNTLLGSGSGGIMAPTVNVNSGGKIQDGVNLSSQTVNVGPGYFKENIWVNKDLSIKGSGKSFTGVDGGQAGSVFIIVPGVNAALSDMTIRNGNANYGGGIRNYGNLAINECTISGNSAELGGGIHNNGILTAIGSTISGNTASSGGGIYSDGTAIVTGGTIYSNSATGLGGGIFNGGQMTIQGGSTIFGNSVDSRGGGISSIGTQLMIQGGSSIYGNSAAVDGGGIYIQFGQVMIQGGSTIYGNSAGIHGGGIFNEVGQVTIQGGSTIYGNSAGFRGGGICNMSPVTVDPSNVHDNTPDDISLP